MPCGSAGDFPLKKSRHRGDHHHHQTPHTQSPSPRIPQNPIDRITRTSIAPSHKHKYKYLKCTQPPSGYVYSHSQLLPTTLCPQSMTLNLQVAVETEPYQGR